MQARRSSAKTAQLMTPQVGQTPPLFLSVLGVVVTEVRLLSDSNKTQYVLQGEGATLLCFFVLSPSEELRRVLWFKDGAEVYVWRRGRRPLARNLFDKRVDLNNRSPSFISILSAHMSMQGNYTCKVETDSATSQNDFFLTVIVGKFSSFTPL
ncbi:hypothetical protein HPB48_004405 [Haemaphysalis longicornis]|uniref:Ig-like domain-containing protein n=1 Tax=Haemaphysalis longicornis TaxID=44386 RepID=A0A9J6G090_HAELO|nr:hypothetical protein HPB48_004405 [Haemaphysalis longicornis]